MGTSYDALNGEAKVAIDWKSKENLTMALADGNERALANRQKFLENNRESLANNPESVRMIILEFKSRPKDMDDDD